MSGYRVRVEARMDILGNVVDRFNVETEYIGKKAAMVTAERIAHKERSHSYGIPVHFKAVKATHI